MIVLDAKTDFSFLRGYGTPKQWLDRCKATGTTALGIADYCSTWGHSQFNPVFKDSGVKLLYGVQLPVVAAMDKKVSHSLVTLIAKNDLKELYETVTMANAQTYYRPRITWAQVKALKDCWVIVNWLAPYHKLIADKIEGAYTSGPKCGLPEVFAYSPRFPAHEDRETYNLMRSIGSQHTIGEVDDEARPLMRMGEAKAWLPISDEALQNAQYIADNTHAQPIYGTLVVPERPMPLRDMAIEGAKKLGLYPLQPEYEQRLDRELEVIRAKNFEDYFYIVADLCRFARERFCVGPGRGSSGGSLLCYLLDITTVDPLKFGTLFERFIDVTRPDLPDIDIDFPDDKRQEVLDYLRSKYGDSRMAKLGTISEFSGKSAFNDTAKAYNIPYDVAREMGRYTEGHTQGSVISPEKVFETVPDAQKLLAKFPKIGMAAKIYDHARHHGVHAAGVVIAQNDMTQFGSLTKEKTICMDMRAAEAMGLVKIDILGLRTLSIINECCELAGIDRNNLSKLDWEDQEIYERVFNAGRVAGIFQFEGQSVSGLLRQTKVTCFEDLCALTSLARPGPLIGGAATAWVKARNGDAEPRQLHPSLDATFGTICYQEQAMSIVRDLAGFSEPEVNGFRRAVGKKDLVKLAGYRGKFVSGAKKFFVTGMVQDQAMVPQPEQGAEAQKMAEDLWEELCEFGSYAFNRSHAVAYCMISFMTAWLKVKHPLEFALAQLRNAADDDSAKILLKDLVADGISFVPFDPALSEVSWSIRDGKLFGGFDGIKGIGVKTAKAMVALRAAKPDGWMDDLTDSQRQRILGPDNTPWHALNYFQNKYATLYEKPESYRVPGAEHGFRGPILQIRNIPDKKGDYAFLGKIARKQIKDANEASRVEKRDGVKYENDTQFFHLFVEDDSGEIPTTVNRYKAKDFPWILENTDGKDYFFRGKIINDGRRWLFIDKILRLDGE